MEENFSMEWNMEENCQYGIWKNRLPFHALHGGGSI